MTYMELLQGARSKQEAHEIKGFLKDFRLFHPPAATLPLSENIGHRASIYVEEYTLANAIGVADALAAATAVEENKVLFSANTKHFKCVKELQLKQSRP